jgi:hypothetical protein
LLKNAHLRRCPHPASLKKHMFGKELGTFLVTERDKTGEVIKKLGGLGK